MLKYFMHHNAIAFGSIETENSIMHDHSDLITVSHKKHETSSAPKITTVDCIIAQMAPQCLCPELLHHPHGWSQIRDSLGCCLIMGNALRGCRTRHGQLISIVSPSANLSLAGSFSLARSPISHHCSRSLPNLSLAFLKN